MHLPVSSGAEVEVGKSGHDHPNCSIISSIKMNIEFVSNQYPQIGIWALDQQIRLAELKNLLFYRLAQKIAEEMERPLHWLKAQVDMKPATIAVEDG